MIKKDDLDLKCLDLYMSGKKFKLNNGSEVLIPSLPIGTRANRFLRLREQLAEPEFINENRKKDDGTIYIEYVKNPKHVDLTSEEGMKIITRMLHEIMQLNYNINAEECDGLFSMAHFDQVITWFYTGREDIGASVSVAAAGNRPIQAPMGGADGSGNGVNGAAANSTTTRSNTDVKAQEMMR